MSNYEFWDELDRIFNAVVAYQEKTVEFNDRFITPWIRLGNVFDKQDRNKEAVSAYRKAIAIDPSNAKNWYELGNIYFQMSDFENAADAYKKSTELSPDSGWAYNNLALTLVSQGKYEESIPLYQMGVELLQDDKDKAVAWNRLGNVYRKLNNYELAVNAFHEADKLDSENAGFRDALDDISDGQNLNVEAASNEGQSGSDVANPIQSILENSQELDPESELTTKAVPYIMADSAPEALSESKPGLASLDKTPEVASEVTFEADAAQGLEVEVQVLALEAVSEGDRVVADEIRGEDVAQPEAVDTSVESQPVESRSILEIVEDVIAKVLAESAPESLEMEHALDEATELPVTTAEVIADIEVEGAALTVEEQNESKQVVLSELELVNDVQQAVAENGSQPEAELLEDRSRATGKMVLGIDHDQALLLIAQKARETFTDNLFAANTETDTSDASLLIVEKKDDLSSEVQIKAACQELPLAEQGAVPDTQTAPANVAYEEYLKDNNGHFKILVNEPVKESETAQDSLLPAELMAKIDSTGDIQIEADAKNAHVWNELGNAYFNTGAYEDAVIAYSKSIELDRQFAWPYSNLALVYVRKGRFAEAMLLYQRSIELFSNEKDKAISWNRLGNVYRRLNDYDNAIAAYQRADDLDTDNTTLSLQSRFSLLGNFHMEKKPSLAA